MGRLYPPPTDINLSNTRPYCLNAPIECIFPLRKPHAQEKNLHK